MMEFREELIKSLREKLKQKMQNGHENKPFSSILVSTNSWGKYLTL